MRKIATARPQGLLIASLMLASLTCPAGAETVEAPRLGSITPTMTMEELRKAAPEGSEACVPEIRTVPNLGEISVTAFCMFMIDTADELTLVMKSDTGQTLSVVRAISAPTGMSAETAAQQLVDRYIPLGKPTHLDPKMQIFIAWDKRPVSLSAKFCGIEDGARELQKMSFHPPYKAIFAASNKGNRGICIEWDNSDTRREHSIALESKIRRAIRLKEEEANSKRLKL